MDNKKEDKTNNCEQSELGDFCEKLVFCILLTMGFLPGWGEHIINNYPLSKAMAGWKRISKFDSMIDNNNCKEYSKVCKCKRTTSDGNLAHVRDKTDPFAFHRATKFYLDYYLSAVPDILYILGDGGFCHYAMYPENDNEQGDGKNLRYNKYLASDEKVDNMMLK